MNSYKNPAKAEKPQKYREIPLELLYLIGYNLNYDQILRFCLSSKETFKICRYDAFWKNRGAKLLGVTSDQFQQFYDYFHLSPGRKSQYLIWMLETNQTLPEFYDSIERNTVDWIDSIKGWSKWDETKTAKFSAKSVLKTVNTESINLRYSLLSNQEVLKMAEDLDTLVKKYSSLSEKLPSIDNQIYKRFSMGLRYARAKPYNDRFIRAGYSRKPRRFDFGSIYLKNDPLPDVGSLKNNYPTVEFIDTGIDLAEIDLFVHSVLIEDFLQIVIDTYKDYYSNLSSEDQNKVITPEKFAIKVHGFKEFDILDFRDEDRKLYHFYVYEDTQDGSICAVRINNRTLPKESEKMLKIGDVHYYSDLNAIYNYKLTWKLNYDDKIYLIAKSQHSRGFWIKLDNGHKIWAQPILS